MSFGELANGTLPRAVSPSYPVLKLDASPNPAGLLIRQFCGYGETYCGDSCMPIGADCCDR